MRLVTLVLFMLLTTATASELTYPELHVVPKASDRIALEVREEAGNAWMSHMPVQLSALSTILAAGMTSGNVKDDGDDNSSKYAPTVGFVVGGLWLASTVWASMKYRPYRKSYIKLKKMRNGSTREKLTRERLAEEEINSLKRIGKRIRWFSAITNLGAAAYMAGAADTDTDEGKRAQTFSTIAGVVALMPLFFNYHWETVANEQEKYKKRIYAPVAMAPILKDQANNNATGFSLLWTF